MWEVNQNKRLLFGSKKLKEVADIIHWYGLKKIFIITYDANAPALEIIKKDLESKNISFCIYDKVQTEPDLFLIDNGTDLLKNEKCDGVLGIGGGSVLDAAKAIAMLATNGGKIEDYQMNGKTIDKATLPLIAIPTTSGTGSEATRVSVVYNNHNGLKKSVYSPCMIADIAILDPEATLDLPPAITAATGIDALSHAIESYVSLNATPFTEMHSLKAIELISNSLIEAVSNGKNIEARSNMMLASYMAGCALSAGIGLAHIIAQPLGGLYKIPHGEACSIFLPLSMEANLEYSLKKYSNIARAMGIVGNTMDDLSLGKLAIKRVKEIIDSVGTQTTISKYITNHPFDLEHTLKIIQGSTGHIKCNPRPVDQEILSETLQRAL